MTISRLCRLCAVALALIAAPLRASTFKPTSDTQVLEVLPRAVLASTPADVVALRQRAQGTPGDVDAAVALASRLVAIGRATADPRPYGQAQAAIAAWWDLAAPPQQVRLLRATIRQYNHDFGASLLDLAAYLKERPDDAGARLMQATVMTVQADYAGAKAACAALPARLDIVLKMSCVASAASFLGDAAGSYARLSAVVTFLGPRDPAAYAWGLTTVGEMGMRLGHGDDALKVLTKAHQLVPTDVYTLVLLSDLLLDRGEPQRVIDLTRERQDQDSLLLRLTMAERRLGLPEAAAHTALLGERFAAERARGTTPHLREEACYLLYLRDDPKGALALARTNFETQREPLDARLLLEAAAAAGGAGDAQPALDWMKATATTEPHMQAARAKLGRG